MGHSLSPNAFWVFRQIQQLKLTQPPHFLLAVSGGADSRALVELFFELKQKKQISWAMMYVHHGLSTDEKLNRYRIRAQKVCAQWAEQCGVEFLLGGPANKPLRSEAQLREFRYSELRQAQARQSAMRIVTAHHAFDQLETRLLNLIRGSADIGLNSLSIDDGEIFRPLLGLWPETFLHTENKKFKIAVDPSNRDEKFRRNFLRRWLRELDKNIAGATKGMGRSLDLLNENFQFLRAAEEKNNFPLCRLEWREMSLVQRRRVLARALRELGTKNYTTSHINEIIKRLDSPRRELTFAVGGSLWTVQDGTICVSRSSL